MQPHGLRRIVDFLHQVLPKPGGGATDAQLLGRFVTERDDEAFTVLVYRHGPMVWGVCQRVLRHRQDAEDAFQATFMLLARKASTILSRQAVASWLYSVAYRTAIESHRTNARHRSQQQCLADVAASDSAAVQDWRPLLDRELGRLPEKYRTPVVLCELQGRSRREVAHQLGVPEGTLSSRLAAARRMLADRLRRRGVSISGGLLAVLLAQEAARASMSATLLVSTATIAVQFASGQSGAMASSAAALTKGVLKVMFLSKLKTVVGTMMIAVALAVGCFAYQASAGSQNATFISASPRGDEKGRDELEALRRENEELKLNLRVTLEKIKALEMEVHSLKDRAERKDTPFETGWDKPVDPDKDCKFHREKGELTIEVPGKDHDLGIERNLMNSPRLLRDVEGDFVAQVRVRGKFLPSEESTTTERIPFVGAGLVLMNGDQTYIRLERAAFRSDEVKTYTNWELREDGKWVLVGDADVKPLKDRDTWLRLERKGDLICGFVSQDGKEWHQLKALEVKLPAKVKVGVAAGTTSTETFKPRFDLFQLTQGK
jgi:RNA polymerase sigma factor (sigma-70 family)